MKTLRRYGKNWNSPGNRRKRSEAARRAVNVRWEREHAQRESEPEVPDDLFRVTVENLVTGKTTEVMFHPGTRRNNLRIVVDGKPWGTCGMVAASKLIIHSLFSSHKGEPK